MAPPHLLRLAIVDDHMLFRVGLAQTLRGWSHCGDIVEASDGSEYEERSRSWGHIDIALIDLIMPRRDGYATIEWIRKKQPTTLPIAITFEARDEAVERALRAGAKGVLEKTIKRVELFKALDDLRLTGFHPNLIVQRHLERVGASAERGGAHPKVSARFTKRELEFLRHLCANDDPSYTVIALRMGISAYTAESYRRALFIKFGVTSRQGLYRAAMQWKLNEC